MKRKWRNKSTSLTFLIEFRIYNPPFKLFSNKINSKPFIWGIDTRWNMQSISEKNLESKRKSKGFLKEILNKLSSKYKLKRKKRNRNPMKISMNPNIYKINNWWAGSFQEGLNQIKSLYRQKNRTVYLKCVKNIA